MNAISWNCRGLGQPLAVPILSELVRVHKPQFIFLCETISTRSRMEEFRVKLNYEGCFTVDCVGRSGGLCMLWKSSSLCTLIGYSNNHIDMHVSDSRGDWRFTGFYGFPERTRRRESWQLLRRLAGINSCPWIILGDFNDLLDPGDKRGRVDHPNWLFTGFRSAVLDCGLSDIPLIGYQFTWSRGLGTANFVEERLDRGMASSAWKCLFPEASIIPLTVPMSDHVPLLLKCSNKVSSLGSRRFRFENKWCLEPEFPNIISDCWMNLHGFSIMEKLEAVTDSISMWARHRGQNLGREKTRLQRMVSSLQGSWASSVDDVQAVALDYFVKLFDVPHGQQNFHQVLDRLTPCINDEKNSELTKDFHIDEFRSALFQMHPDKSPGPDGLNPKFYQSCWNVVGEDVFKSCSTWLSDGMFPDGLNHTLISLIPKVDSPANMKELRPIALCNVLYKIVSKVLCNRLRHVLPDLIDNTQSAFVEGRLIQDNILIAFETIHTMKRQTRGKFGSFAFKIDISKAYDRVNWAYLDAVLRRLGFCDKWRGWMRLCVQTVSYDVLVNNVAVGPILPGRGLRQGDPLSPYLFILCAEGLSAMVKHETARGAMHGVKMGRGGPFISHLMFADDCLFFCRAEAQECEVLKRVLRDYEEASGQAINLQKSGIFFSSNVSEVLRADISSIMGVSLPLNTGRYLGLPSLVGRKKREIFSYLRERLWTRIQGWHNKKLSKAGKEILIKGVAQALPSFCMGIFSLPISLTDELERMLNSFWWGNNAVVGKGIKWLKWEKLCIDKKLGGLGFRSLQLLNVALLGKTCWRLIEEPEALMCQVMHAKYFPNGDFLSAGIGHNPSYTWRSIISAQDLVRRGIRWRIGDGTRVRFFHDPWLRTKDTFRPSLELCPPHLANVMVSDMLLPDSNRWNFDLLQEMVPAADVQEIMSTPVFSRSGADELIWHFSSNGRYTVKSAYQLASSLTLDITYNVDGNWDNLWKLTVPPKVKNFLWRAARDNLPSKAKLLSRSIAVGGECPICSTDYETLWHLFLCCPFAEECWRISRLSGIINPLISASDSFVQLLFKIVDHPDGVFKIKASMLLWQIWKDRNRKVWNEKQPVPATAVMTAASTWTEWRLARGSGTGRSSQQAATALCLGWHPLPPGSIKCNVDAAFFEAERMMGIGMVIRDHNGAFAVGRSIKLPGCRSVEEAELVGIKEALSWIKELGFTKGVIESDCKRAVDMVKSVERNISELGVMASLCRGELVLFPDLRLIFVKRELNAIAHCLAKAARNFISHHVWTEPPIAVAGLLHLPCSCEQ
ncbi:uncharacterized protein LOC130998129 [Salvia miltiorrhiza]|uniref:uncharacterized protein LOC130998129 n=1 Tax=Salvia miltiorrhiza TaxID=226208 RepID=UPI0025AC456B|nr:uncharacterized protein LOC130998129 [Salvia miltiorrhiza]